MSRGTTRRNINLPGRDEHARGKKGNVVKTVERMNRVSTNRLSASDSLRKAENGVFAEYQLVIAQGTIQASHTDA